MQFKITKDSIFEDNPELNSIPELAACTSNQLKYVIFTYDYKSPIRGMDLGPRKIKACELAGYKLEKGGKRPDKTARMMIAGNSIKVNKAIAMFKSIQFDFDKEILLGYDTQITEWKKLLMNPDKSPKEQDLAFKVMKELPSIIGKRAEILKELDMRGDIEEEVDEENPEDNLSLIDQINMGLENE
jgi:hypothetical protein